MIKYPTNYDIYIETGGEKIAVVLSYNAKHNNNGQYVIELNRIYLTDEAIRHGVNIYGLKDFDFIVQKHDRIIKYTGCNWCLIDTSGYNTIMIDKTIIVAKNRKESLIDDEDMP